MQKILIADDDIQLGHMLKEDLLEVGYVTDYVNNGIAVMDYLEKDEVEVLFWI